MKQVLIAAAVAMTFAPAWAADQTYNVDVVVVGAGAGGTVAAVSAVEGGLKTLMLENLKTVESTLSQIRRRRARGTSGLWPSSP